MLDNKNNKKQFTLSKIEYSEIVTLFFVLLFSFISYVFVFPNKSGLFGWFFYVVTSRFFGTASYFVLLLFLLYFSSSIKSRKQKNENRKKCFALLFSFVISFVILLEILRSIFSVKISGGLVGEKLYKIFIFFFGIRLSLVMIVIVFFFSIAKIIRYLFIDYVCVCFVKFKCNLKSIKNNIYDVKRNIINKFVLRKKLFTLKIFNKKFKKQNIVNNYNNDKKLYSDHIVGTTSNCQIKINDKPFDYKFPNMDLFNVSSTVNFNINKNNFLERAKYLKKTLLDFCINADIKEIVPGPVVTRYDLTLAPGVKVQSLLNISDNISLAMRAVSIRILPIPEKSAIGIEVPNILTSRVGLREVLESNVFKNSRSSISLALGKTTEGFCYVIDLISMPHLLIAGATGSGKSVCIHSIILSILYKARPDEVKFVLIDPKQVELVVYRDIPHIYNPCTDAINADIITDANDAIKVLKKLIVVMNERYAKFAKQMVRNIEEYNNKMIDIKSKKEFYIVVIIDEFADLVLNLQKEIEDSIQRLSQMSRAVGIHLIIATQRPSVNIITGIIKANFTARLSFQTTSRIDSRVILDTQGAECLIGKGDMLFLKPGEARPIRLQGAYVSLKEAEKIVSFINCQKFPKYYDIVTTEFKNKNDLDKENKNNDDEKKIILALKFINERKRVSHDLLKENFGGSSKAANILSILELRGFILKPNGTNRWKINHDKIINYLETK